MSHVKNKTSDEIKELLEVRETQLNFSALFHVVKGAMTSNDSATDSRHVECLSKLIDLGANIEARDFAGFTPLFYCVTKFASPASVKMAKILLRRGANPNAQNRIGMTPLGEP